MSLVDSLLDKSSVSVKVSGLPELTIDLDPSKPSSPLVQALKPKVTVRRQGQVLLVHAPYGEPSSANVLPWVALAGLIMFVVVVLRLGK